MKNPQHIWVKHTITPVDVVPDPQSDTGFVVMESDLLRQVAEGMGVHGCSLCSVPLLTSTIHTNCTVADEEEPHGSE